MAGVTIKSQTSAEIVLEVTLSDPFTPTYYDSAGVTSSSFAQGASSISNILNTIYPEPSSSNPFDYYLNANLFTNGNTYYVYAQDATDHKYWLVGAFVYYKAAPTRPPTPSEPVLVQRRQLLGSRPILEFEFRTYFSLAYYLNVEYKKTTQSWNDAVRVYGIFIDDLIQSGTNTYRFSIENRDGYILDFSTTYHIRIQTWAFPGAGYDEPDSEWSTVATATTAPKAAYVEWIEPKYSDDKNQFWYNVYSQAYNNLFTYYDIKLFKGETLIADDGGATNRKVYYSDGYNPVGYKFSNLQNGTYKWEVRLYYYANGVYISAVNSDGTDYVLTVNFTVEVVDPKPLPFNWTPTELNALNNNGKTNVILYTRWNTFLDKVDEWLVYKKYNNVQIGQGSGLPLPSTTTYSGVLNNAYMASVDKALTALRFNCARYCIGSMNPTGINNVSTGDVVYGSYFITLAGKLNNITS